MKGFKTLPINSTEWALSKNNGESVKYKIRKQEEREANEELLNGINGEDEDLFGGLEAEVPGVDR
jgi:hypothetical protein